MFFVIAKPMKKGKDKLLGEISARLDGEKIPYELHVTTRKGEAAELAASLPAAGDTLLAVGGDGTLNEVLSGMDPARNILGLIPAGTGNDFASAAKIPYGAAALDLILGGEPEYTDYISFADGRRSLNIAGIGIDVDILLRCERMKHLHAKSKYFLSLLASLTHYRGTPMKVRVNGEEREGNYLIAAICNGSRFGGGIPICPPAEIGDGKLELITVDCPKRRKIPGALIKLMKGKVLDLPFAHAEQCKEAELIPAAPFTAQYDGELFGGETFSGRIVHRELKMYRGRNESL